MCGVSDDRCTSAARRLFGTSVVGLLVVVFVPLVLSFLAVPGLSLIVTHTPTFPHTCMAACWPHRQRPSVGKGCSGSPLPSSCTGAYTCAH